MSSRTPWFLPASVIVLAGALAAQEGALVAQEGALTAQEAKRTPTPERVGLHRIERAPSGDVG